MHMGKDVLIIKSHMPSSLQSQTMKNPKTMNSELVVCWMNQEKNEC